MDPLILTDGMQIGEHLYTRLTMAPLNAGEAIDAATAGEKVRFAPDGEPVIVTSPTIVSTERLRRQVKQLESKAGTVMQGPIQIVDLRKMSEGDYRKLVERADQIDALYLQRESDKGGRDEAGAGEGADGTGA
ncbi:hypothetical protein [Thalassospira povalilytica]|uniref:hypothetical protein n=1 Tax=Thalassospira povalilytica TaxID=732237 RepID=UPI003AA9D0FF